MELDTSPDRSWDRVRRAIPTGRSLDAEVHRSRHRTVAVTLAVVGLGVAGLAVALGSTGHAALASLVAALAATGTRGSRARRARSVAVGAGLAAVAAVAVDLTGTTEAHFLFFIAVPLIAFYEDWLPFATTVGLVSLYHLVGGVLFPGLVFHHGAAVAQPVTWSLVHTGLLSLMVVATVAHWRQHEVARSRNAQLLEALHHESRRDPLTGAANRRVARERLAQELERAARSGTAVAVLAVDLDGFKPLNDTYGHAIGDQVLVSVARRLEEASRLSDVVARTGGDEFLAILPDTSEGRAREVAERLLAVLAAPYPQALDAAISASIGVGVACAAASVDDVLRRADEAMYEAKRRGRATVVVAGAEAPTVPIGVHVSPADARAWSRYVAGVRAEIADRKEDGGLPQTARAPESVHRTLRSLLAAIEQLPDTPAARLPLPDRTSLEEFWFHHGGVQAWVDDLTEEGRLTVRRTAAAQRFWDALGAEVVAGAPARVGQTHAVAPDA